MWRSSMRASSRSLASCLALARSGRVTYIRSLMGPPFAERKVQPRPRARPWQPCYPARMNRLGALALPILALAACLAAAQAPKPQRVALVIGNGKYAESPLPNANHDAADIAKELKAAGFTVIERQDASLKDMRLALR